MQEARRAYFRLPTLPGGAFSWSTGPEADEDGSPSIRVKRYRCCCDLADDSSIESRMPPRMRFLNMRRSFPSFV